MNMELNQTVECTFFASAFNVNDLQITTLDQYIDQIRSKKYASAITRLRAEYLAGHAEEGDKRKKKLPLLVAGGIMKGGRTRTPGTLQPLHHCRYRRRADFGRRYSPPGRGVALCQSRAYQCFGQRR